MTTALAEKPASIDALIVGESAPMQMLKAMIKRVAHADVPVLITGPSGAGKEMAARAIHAAGPRAGKPFVAINCGAIPAELIESELFGHERGAFTGANARRIGRFEEASGGTLFLDEIGDMRFDMQVKLLRVLEEGVINRVGGGTPIKVDVRIVSATHQDLEVAIAENRFREDLYFRLGVVPIDVPCLARRAADLPLLVEHLQARQDARARASFDRSAMARLAVHHWPGNVRELRNLIARAGVLHAGETIDGETVTRLLGRAAPQVTRLFPEPEIEIEPILPSNVVALAPRGQIDLKQQVEAFELERIHNALGAAAGVISEAARMLTLKRTTLIEKMRKYGIEKAAA